MARALIVGCGCRGRALGRELLERGWQVRGTTRRPAKLAEIEAAGLEAALADPDQIATVLAQIEGVSLIFWLLGAAEGEEATVSALHGPRLERLLEQIVDTPVRGFVYELSHGLSPADALRAFEILRHAGETWRIPFEVVEAGPAEHELWLDGMLGAAAELVG